MPRRLRATKLRGALEIVDASIDLIVGPTPPRSRGEEFAHRQRIADLEPLWWRHRDELLDQHPPGSRPWSWWRYEQHRDPPSGDAVEAAELARLGELSPAEVARLRSDAERFGDTHRQLWRAVAKVIEEKPVVASDVDEKGGVRT